MTGHPLFAGYGSGGGSNASGERADMEKAQLLHRTGNGVSKSADEEMEEENAGAGGKRVLKYLVMLGTLLGAATVCLFVVLEKKITIYGTANSISDILSGAGSEDDHPRGMVMSSSMPYSASEVSSKPNIIFLLADDLGWNSIGHEDYDIDFTTPTLTAMAAKGITMENYYAQEVCTPARGSLLTGRHPLSIGMQYFMVESAIPWGLELNETTIAEVMSDNGYKTHMLGKWHLGHSTPRYLPTARGFDTFTGMLNGESYYWSKRNPDHPHFKDFLASDRDCFWPYDEEDIHDYSTHQYRDMAVEIIENHDTVDPLFMYLSFQAVHDPFDDVNGVHEFGIPKEYMDGQLYHRIKTEVVGLKRQQYAMALYLMDKAVSKVTNALEVRGMMNNTYIIFSSDNGGCHAGGGKNGPLRGTKGSLFEGGVKVDAFIYSPLLPASTVGLQYQGLMHISDWMPTVLELSGADFTPATGFELDGFSHVDAWLGDQSSSSYPREVVLYNYYTNVDFYTFNIWVNGSFAIRDAQYKLMHTFNSSTYGAWYSTSSIDEDDDALDADVRCAPQAGFGDGDFTYYLFDLLADPYETNNLYDSTDEDLVAAKESLYSYLQGFVDKSTELSSSMRGNQVAFQVWREHGDFIVPWVKMDDLDASKGSFPSDCYVEDEAAEDETEEADAEEEEEDADADIADWVEETGLLDFTSNTANGVSLGDSPSTDASASTSTSTSADTSGLSGTSSLPALSTTTTSTTTSTASTSATNAASGLSSATALPALSTGATTSTTTASKMASNPNARQGSKPKAQGSSSGVTRRTRIRRKK